MDHLPTLVSGALFTQAYANSVLCAVSRVAAIEPVARIGSSTVHSAPSDDELLLIIGRIEEREEVHACAYSTRATDPSA